MVIGGSSLTAALVYAYKTINSDSARYNERIAQLEARPKRAVANVAPVTEAAAIVETAIAENTTIVEVTAAEPVVEVVDVEAEETPEHVDAAMEGGNPTVTVRRRVIMSDLLSTVKILAGSTAEIAAASVGDQRLVAAVKLAEENNSVEILNGLKVVDVKAEVSAEVPKEAEVEEAMIGRSNLKIVGEELEELSSALHAVEETTVEVADDHVQSEADSPVVAEVYVESPASSEEASVMEMESILELEESVSPVVVMSDDDTISGPAEVTSEAVKAVGQGIEEDIALSHEPADTETEHADLTAPPTDLDEALQGTTEAAEVVVEMMDAVEEAEPEKASDEAVESGNVTMTMAQA
ncbi:hypothetical protein DPX16_14179 [Anabarilius grahami]|uniref:Uncharacterized protein n=1 Tax=Anabarilius grahami TaxID=495550 RepID=A0A3N0XF05_ANAGA|nr:hypothetical protein DPX16_14179 [Anabarilius grahami]